MLSHALHSGAVPSLQPSLLQRTGRRSHRSKLEPALLQAQIRLAGQQLRQSQALNDSQVAAVEAALGRTLTLWQVSSHR